jgi:asparagine synthase (glutamine-hydrolysing)
MCSFIFTNKEINDVDYVNYYNKFRGPDNTNIFKFKNFTFLHNLLSITGEFTIQPFVDENIICLYNGEIYNYENFGTYKSDGECLIPLYKKEGINFIKKLDGEFAITLVDFDKQIIIISTDTFKTKPIFYSTTNGIGTSSYSEPLKRLGHENVIKMEPNTTIVVDLNTFEIIEKLKVHEFDTSNQTKDNFDDWIKAFKNSIYKRTKGIREKIFIGLSGGYDSGAICCELVNQGVDFTTYTVVGTENQNILNQRFKIIEKKVKNVILTKNSDEIGIAHEFIEKNTEPLKYFTYSNSSDYNEYWLSLIDDNGSNHLSHLCSHAKKDGKKIFLSGQGADEIFSDYGFGGVKKYNHSNFGGLFTDDLKEIFPWPSFFNSSMESYLAKEEYVCGSYGIESRYPFLDKNLVQEFLWLSPKLKNSNYKSVLDFYLTKNNFPFDKNNKVGF